ncbi:MAG TPA: NAD(P)H-dependent oxidoreductase [Methylocella sp.]|nr:NAD(P)H-dependent oxidoreductase [Methylocella sp.]
MENRPVSRRIVIIQGHPDKAGQHFCHALADAYAQSAEAAGHVVQRIEVALLDFPLLRSKEEFYDGPAPAVLQPAQDAIANADHLVIIYPLWLGSMPALLRAFFEQTFRPRFAFELAIPSQGLPKLTKRFKGKSARIIVTMRMPAFIYRWYYYAHGLKSLKRNILGFCGVAPIRESLIGSIEAPDDALRKKWLAKMTAFGRAGS